MAAPLTSDSDIPTSLPPALDHLLRSNDWPSPHEEVLIGEMSRLVDMLLFSTKVSIACTSTLVDLDGSDSDTAIFLTQPAPSPEQKNRQMLLQKLHDQLQAIHAPVRRLPREILQEIFLAIDADVKVFDDKDPHYVVGRVCREWRVVSRHCCPRMWCQLDLKNGPAPLANAIEDRLRTVLDCTRGFPLRFSLHEMYFVEPSVNERETFNVLLGVLAQYSMQWESALLDGLRLNEAHVLSAIRGRVPLLRTLDLRMAHPGTEVDRVCRAFEIAPKLAHLRLHDVPLGHIAVPHPNLQTVCVDCVGFNRVPSSYLRGTPPLHELLRLSPNVRAVNIDRTISPAWEHTELDMAWPPSHIPPRVVYADVVSLTTSDFVSLYYISLPNLKDLRVGPSSLHPEADSLITFLPAVTQFMRHSRCALSQLTLQHGAWRADNLCEMLGLVPEVEEFSVVYPQSDYDTADVAEDDILDVLWSLTEALRVGEFFESDAENDVLERRPKYLPRLKTLAIKTSLWVFVNKDFVDMVATRWGKDGLRTLRFEDAHEDPKVFPSLEPSDWDRLMNMKKSGLEISWENTWHPVHLLE